MNSICPVCASTILRGRVVLYDGDGLTHIDCHNGVVGDAADKVVALLARHPDEHLCRRCLAGELSLPQEAVQKAIVRLQITSEVAIRLGDCSRCDRPQVTVRARIFRRSRGVADE